VTIETKHDELGVDRSMTIPEFCALERISTASYVKMRKLGLGPEELRVPDMKMVRITPASRLEWHAKMAVIREQRATQLESERRRRSEQASLAGKKGAASATHWCRLPREQRQRKRQRRG